MVKLFSCGLVLLLYCAILTIAELEIDQVEDSESEQWNVEIEDTQIPLELPENLSIDVRSGTSVQISWDPPKSGKWSNFKLQLTPLSTQDDSKTFDVEENQFLLKRFLEPGGTYQIKLFTEYQSEISTEFLTTNFTTKPNPPDRFIVWYRNETSMLIYWQPPAGIIDYYKVEIQPNDSGEAMYISKEAYQSGKIQPGFYNLVPGRAYNLSVVTMSQDQFSVPLTKEYRTIPTRPSNVTVESDSITTSSFLVKWAVEEATMGEYDGFNVYLNKKGIKPVQRFVSKDKSVALIEDDSLEPGITYEVSVKTVSGKVSSWPVSRNVTLRAYDDDK